MSDEDILKTVADELRRFGDFDNIDYLIPNLGQAIENILAKYDRALSDLVKAEKENDDLKKEIEKFNKQLDLDYVDKNYISVSLVEETIGELNKAYEDSKDENGESEYYYPDYTIRVLEELLERRK